MNVNDVCTKLLSLFVLYEEAGDNYVKSFMIHTYFICVLYQNLLECRN